MAKLYCLSPATVPENPHLFPMMRPTFIGHGHSFVDRIEEADVVLFDLHSRIADYKQHDISVLLHRNLPIACFDEWDRMGMSAEKWPLPITWQQKEVLDYIHKKNIKVVHFCRLFDNADKRPDNLYPYEKSILYQEEPVTADELFSRPYDIVWIANSAPQREALFEALADDRRLNCYLQLGKTKIPFNEWVDKHKQGKFFITCSGGGATDERVQALFSIATILKDRTNQLRLHDYTHLENCLLTNAPPTKQDLDTLVEICNDKDRLHKIYTNGYNFVKQYYSAEYIAGDILGKIEKHLL